MRASQSGRLAPNHCRARLVLSRYKAIFSPLDHASLTRRAADEGIDHRTCHRRRFQRAPRSCICFTSLEDLAQQLIRRHVANIHPCVERVGGKVVRRSQGCRVRRHIGAWLMQAPNLCGAIAVSNAGIAGPGDAEIFARGALCAEDIGMRPSPGNGNRACAQARAHPLLRGRARCSPIGTSC